MAIKHELFSNIVTLGTFHGGFHTSRCVYRIIRLIFTANSTVNSASSDAITIHACRRPNAVVTETVILLGENVVDCNHEN